MPNAPLPLGVLSTFMKNYRLPFALSKAILKKIEHSGNRFSAKCKERKNNSSAINSFTYAKTANGSAVRCLTDVLLAGFQSMLDASPERGDHFRFSVMHMTPLFLRGLTSLQGIQSPYSKQN